MIISPWLVGDEGDQFYVYTIAKADEDIFSYVVGVTTTWCYYEVCGEEVGEGGKGGMRDEEDYVV